MATEIHPYLTLKGLEDQLELTKKEVKAGGYLPGGIWFKDTETIVCGTFPPRAEFEDKKGNKRKGYLHYSSNRNQFWRHIDDIFKLDKPLFEKLYKDDERITSAKRKIDFIRSKKIGFIDIFTEVERKPSKRENAKDANLVPIKTIFDNGIFTATLNRSVCKYLFVYSLARNAFKNKLKKRYTNVTRKEVQQRTGDNIPEIVEITVNRKTVYLIYAPIHGGIKKKQKQEAIRSALERSCR